MFGEFGVSVVSLCLLNSLCLRCSPVFVSSMCLLCYLLLVSSVFPAFGKFCVFTMLLVFDVFGVSLNLVISVCQTQLTCTLNYRKAQLHEERSRHAELCQNKEYGRHTELPKHKEHNRHTELTNTQGTWQTH